MKIKKTISSLFKREILTQVQDDVLLPKARRPKRSAFTLAELLITLGIIGVVAAITIPTLVAEYQNRSWSTASTVFQRKLGEALQVMNVQQTLTGWERTEDFVTELSKHLKIVNTCKDGHLTPCFADTVVWGDEEIDMSKVTKAKNFDIDWNTNIVGIQTADGVNALVAYNPDCESNPYASTPDPNNPKAGSAISFNETGLGVGNCLAVLYDVQGFSKPNKQNMDIRDIGGIKLGEGSTCIDGVFCYTKVLAPGDYDPVDCSDPNADGYEYCGDFHYDHNYFVGAMKACKGKLPNMNDLKNMTNYIYNTDKFTSQTSCKHVDDGIDPYNGTRASEFGLPSSPTGWVPIYSSSVSLRWVGNEQSCVYNGGAGDEMINGYAICLE